MPKPKGWTPEMVAARDACVKEIVNKLPPAKTAEQREQSARQRAYAICTASVEMSKRGGGNPPPLHYAMKLVGALKKLAGVAAVAWFFYFGYPWTGEQATTISPNINAAKVEYGPYVDIQTCGNDRQALLEALSNMKLSQSWGLSICYWR